MADRTAMEHVRHPFWTTRTLLHAQAILLVATLAISALAPRRDAATLVVPLVGTAKGPLAWALAHGAAVAGPGPDGGVILVKADTSLGWRALLDGALAIRLPETLCTNASTLDG
ncbi:hypothetical protein OVA07_11825 [Novosphingobium sp. SL115]|uniref:hypothetical protein n=1 Tax=Novosphingobium sp. SL115 TaxID=2995150 RepID=UPI0022746B1A|nr:hypothetical protein [Novosphingobium sp. SL115]MCY1671694.1 hypothetical protein [Novosphingobium sp. SL115]